MIDNLYNTVTFSGADVTVVAYRDILTPAEEFSVKDAENKLKELDTQSVNLKKQIKEEEAISNTKVTNLDRIALDNYKFSTSADKTIGLTPPSFGNEGKSQNTFTASPDFKFNSKGREYQDSLAAVETERLKVSSYLSNVSETTRLILSNLHTVTYSSFREKFAVRSLGRTHAKGYTRGPRTIAGTLVFNAVQEQELLLLAKSRQLLDQDHQIHPSAVMVDQIEPFHLMLLFANEYGAYSALHLFNLEVASEGQEMSIDTILTQNSFNFYATDIIPMTSLGNRFASYNDMLNEAVRNGIGQQANKSGDTRVKYKHSPDNLLNNPFLQKDQISKMLSDSRGLF